jgi:O-antigen ligase
LNKISFMEYRGCIFDDYDALPAFIMRNIQKQNNGDIIDVPIGSSRFNHETLDVSPEKVRERKYTVTFCLFIAVLMTMPLFFGGRSEITASTIKALFFSLFFLRALWLTYQKTREKGFSLSGSLTFFPEKDAYLYFSYCIPLLLFVSFQVLPLPYPVLSFLAPVSAEAYAKAGAFVAGGAGYGYISLNPRDTLAGLTWLLSLSLLGAEFLSCHFKKYGYSSRRRSSSKRSRSSAQFAQSSREFDLYAETLQSSLVYTAFICALIAISHLASGAEQLFGMFAPDVIFQGHSRAHWPFVSPNHLAVVLEIGLILSFVRILRDRQLRGLSIEIREDEPFIKRFSKLVSQWEHQAKDIVICLVIFLALFLSGSRAGIFLSVLALTSLWVFYRMYPVQLIGARRESRRGGSSRRNSKHTFMRGSGRFFQIALFPVLLFFVAFFFMGDRSRNQLASRVETGVNEGLDFGRRQLQGISLQVFSSSPLWGVGVNSWKEKAPAFASDELAPWKLDFAHNEYLHFLSEIGLIGLLCALFPVGIAIRRFAKKLHLIYGFSIPQKFYFFGTLAALLVPLLHSFVDFPLHLPATTLCVFAVFVLFARNLSRGEILKDD